MKHQNTAKFLNDLKKNPALLENPSAAGTKLNPDELALWKKLAPKLKASMPVPAGQRRRFFGM